MELLLKLLEMCVLLTNEAGSSVLRGTLETPKQGREIVQTHCSIFQNE